MNLIIGILEQGLIFSIVCIGVYITYRILDFPDLSVDGTFPLGASAASVCIINDINPFIACIIAFLAGTIGGAVTGLLHVKFKIANLLSGILVMIGLYSINLRIMSKSNIPLFGENTIFSSNTAPIITIIIFTILTKIVLDIFLKTKLGFILRAVGNNEQVVTLLGVNKDKIKILGLMLSNGFVALAGAMMAQYQGFADINMGTGTVVMGLAAVIIGESIFNNMKFMKITTMIISGSVLYKGAIALALKFGLAPTDLKLITVIIVIAALSINNKNFNFKRKVIIGGETIAQSRKFI